MDCLCVDFYYYYYYLFVCLTAQMKKIIQIPNLLSAEGGCHSKGSGVLIRWGRGDRRAADSAPGIEDVYF